ncbi:hypothetical protein [Lysobacter firmicutimachus]|uniref:Uncharacterized protein n=1 Tax=Lysobacter firmicutimachus TaxID=1792846 RepID=A0ABU8D2S5_9GAMM
MRSNSPKPEKPLSYQKEIEARILALETLVLGLLYASRDSAETRKGVVSAMHLMSDTLLSEGSGATHQFREAWRAEIAHALRVAWPEIAESEKTPESVP